MANKEHVRIVLQGPEAIKTWRKSHPNDIMDLSKANLRELELDGADLSGANLNKAILFRSKLAYANFSKAKLTKAILVDTDLRGANLSCADLRDADLWGANLRVSILTPVGQRVPKLSGADFRGAILGEVNLRGTDLSGVNLSGTDLTAADLSEANLSGANLSSADLRGANLNDTNLSDTDLGNVALGRTSFSNVDLSSIKDVAALETITHHVPSILDSRTLIRSATLPITFLRGCGLSDWEIEAARLYSQQLNNEKITDIIYKIHDLRAHQAIQINPLFISYSHADREFVDYLETALNEKGVRYWRDIHDATSGRLEKQIELAIRHNPTVLLILSSSSVNSDWVQHEARLARNLELETKKDVLCPISLDTSWKTCQWPERLREQIMEYNILDFSEWKKAQSFNKVFTKLFTGLDVFYHKEDSL